MKLAKVETCKSKLAKVETCKLNLQKLISADIKTCKSLKPANWKLQKFITAESKLAKVETCKHWYQPKLKPRIYNINLQELKSVGIETC